MKPSDKEPKVVFCDNHLLMVYKPAGMPTQEHRKAGANLEQWARAWIKQKYNKRGNVFLQPIHRLDTPVSGLVLFARTSKSLSRLQEQQRAQKIRKTYYAYVEGILPERTGSLEHLLVHGSHRAHIGHAADPRAKRAALHYRVLSVRQGISHLEIILETGRYHQIRAQLAAIGYPIVGDLKYGSSRPCRPGVIALEGGKVEFVHPVTKKPLVLCC